MQKEYYVHKAHYAFTPFKAFLKGSQNATNQYLIDEHGNTVHSLIWWMQLPPGGKLVADATGRYSIDLTDIPPIPNEDYMPPIGSFLYHLQFYYKSAIDSGDFWVTEAKRWSKEVDHFAEPTKPLKEAVAGLIAPSDSDIDKARKLYKAVQDLDNTDFSREKSKSELKQLGIRAAKRAEDTLAQKSGTSQDIALLYLAMLRAAGLTAYDMRVVNRTRAYLSRDTSSSASSMMTSSSSAPAGKKSFSTRVRRCVRSRSFTESTRERLASARAPTDARRWRRRICHTPPTPSHAWET
jgi:hypothetical protein